MNRLFITLLTVFLATSTVNCQEVKAVEAEGNLAVTDSLGCVSIDEVTTDHTPADIYAGIAKCIENEDYINAAQLFAIAGVYGSFDTKRVKDRSAHQALSVLSRQVLSSLDDSQKEAFIKALKEELEAGSNKLYALCDKINDKGHPTYFPTYMIQHGMGAFTDDEEEPLKEDFDAEKAFQESLNQYLHCDE